MARQYKQGPKGDVRFAHVTTPDTKFNADGLFKIDQYLEGDAAEEFKAEIDAATEEALREHTKDMKPGEAKKWSAHYPYEVEENEDTGAPTGRIIVKYKQNAVIFMEDGSKKPVTISVRDSKNKVTKVPVYARDTVKVLYAPRVTVATANKTVGLRLDFCAVQLLKKAERVAGGGFDEEEGGFVDESDEQETGSGNNRSGSTHEDDSGDY